MTEQEAIKKLKYTKRNCGMPIQGDVWKPNAETIAIDMAISALEKQIAVSRAIVEGKYFCPKCKNLMPHPGYCECGQKLY